MNYYFWATYRRKKLDKLQERYKNLYCGIVLDIGGRDRGKFKKPRDKVKKWIFADIEKKHNPDLVLDVANMGDVKNKSIDIINAIELFEHVEQIDKGLDECYRVLKNEGKLIISVPFLYQIHADPYDFQRWTETKWRKELTNRNFKIENFEVMGRFFTVYCGMIKELIESFPKIFKYPLRIGYPFLDTLVRLDEKKIIIENKILNKYHGGYFIIAKK
jgi:SAM-dependent methyltransferase